ncbi:hypothetical protein MYAM1_000781 [Malassezia yamatoensis]|uniref:Uncharacterized protein n=1 Tax=Malassezia yamatoensis TaxID=253288 RepID=A0AAJ5YPE8_9BASI|nr:hypothetical protein MYAM1_000781 [Malassezia yamatoensis]
MSDEPEIRPIRITYATHSSPQAGAILPHVVALMRQQFPLRNLHWRPSPATRSLRPLSTRASGAVSQSQHSIRTLQMLPIDLVPIQTPIDRRDTILARTPFVHLFFVACNDNDLYRSKIRSEIRNWIASLPSYMPQDFAKLRMRNEDGREVPAAIEPEFLIVLVPTMAETNLSPGASIGGGSHPAISSSYQAQSSSTKGPMGRFYNMNKGNILEKLKADFNSSSHERVVHLPRLPGTSSPAATNDPVLWIELMARMKECVATTFCSLVELQDRSITLYDSHYRQPNWSFSGSLSCTEQLIEILEGVALLEDSLALYQELSLRLSAGLADGSATFERIGGDQPGDDSLLLLGPLSKPYHRLLEQGTISLFDLHCYLYAQQAMLLGTMGHVIKVLHATPNFIANIAHMFSIHGVHGLPEFFVEAWSFSVSLDAVEQSQAWLVEQTSEEGEDSSQLPVFHAAKAELLELAIRQLLRIGVLTGQLPDRDPFSVACPNPLDYSNASGASLSRKELAEAMKSRDVFDVQLRNLIQRALLSASLGKQSGRVFRLKYLLGCLDIVRESHASALILFDQLLKTDLRTSWGFWIAAVHAERLACLKNLNRDNGSEWMDANLAALRTICATRSSTPYSQPLDEEMILHCIQSSSDQLDSDATFTGYNGFSVQLRKTRAVRDPTDDGAWLEVAVYSHLGFPLTVSQISVCIANYQQTQLWFESKSLTLQPGPNQCHVFCPISAQGFYHIQTIQLQVSQHFVLEQLDQSALSLTNLADAQQHEYSRTRVFLAADGDSADVKAFPQMHVPLDSPRRAVLEVRSGRNQMNASLTIESSEDSTIDTSLPFVMHSDSPEVHLNSNGNTIELKNMTRDTVCHIELPFITVPKSGRLELVATLRYFTQQSHADKERLLHRRIPVSLALPFGIHIQDYFRLHKILSKLTLEVSLGHFARISIPQVIAPSSAALDIQLPSAQPNLLIPDHPSSVLFQFSLKEHARRSANTEPFRLTVAYRGLKEEAFALVISELANVPSLSELDSGSVRLLIDALGQVLVGKLDLSRYAWTNHLDLGVFHVQDWSMHIQQWGWPKNSAQVQKILALLTTLFQRLETTTLLPDASTPLHIPENLHESIKIALRGAHAQTEWRTLSLPLDVPLIDVVAAVTVESALSSAIVAQPIEVEIRIEISLQWGEQHQVSLDTLGDKSVSKGTDDGTSNTTEGKKFTQKQSVIPDQEDASENAPNNDSKKSADLPTNANAKRDSPEADQLELQYNVASDYADWAVWGSKKGILSVPRDSLTSVHVINATLLPLRAGSLLLPRVRVTSTPESSHSIQSSLYSSRSCPDFKTSNLVMSGSQQVRPRLVDLADVEGDDDGTLMNWPAAAKVVRKPPPDVGANHSKQVRFASSVSESSPERSSKFEPTASKDFLQQPPDVQEQADASMPSDDAPIEPPFVPVMGTIRERNEDERSSEPRAAPKTSRFRAQRQGDRDITNDQDPNQKSMSAFRRSRLMREQNKPSMSGSLQFANDPMPEASLNDRHLKSEVSYTQSFQRDTELNSVGSLIQERERKIIDNKSMDQDPSRDPGGGAPPDQITSILASVSAENAKKVSQMNYKSVEEELEDAISFFGADTLAKLQARHSAMDTRADEKKAKLSSSTNDEQAPEQELSQMTHTGGWPSLERRLADLDVQPENTDTQKTDNSQVEQLEAFRAKYFPEEPQTMNSSLEWTLAENQPSTASGIRFDFAGDVSWYFGQTVHRDGTYAAGLHHHGDQQQAPGYTIDELLHLVQSTVASQRTIALQVLGRVCCKFPLGFPFGSVNSQTSNSIADQHAQDALNRDTNTTRANIMLSARWLLSDRHRSVQDAAVQCLASVLTSVSVFPVANVGELCRWKVTASPLTDWTWLGSLHDDSLWTPHFYLPYIAETDASYLELIRRDWSKTLLDTDVLLALDSIAATRAALDTAAKGAVLSNAVTDLRDALLRTISSIVLHNHSAAEAFPRYPNLVRLITQLGATTRSWPLAEMSTWPEPTALAVVLRCVQASAAAAETLMGQGVFGGVLRYIVLPAFSYDDKQAEKRAGTLLCFALRILAALASYGQCSTSVREAWPAIQRLGPWAAEKGDSSASAAFFDLLAIWTHLARHAPHNGDLGVTWPTVRGWYEWSIKAIMQSPDLATHTSAISHLACWETLAQELEPSAGDSFEWRSELVGIIQNKLPSVKLRIQSQLSNIQKGEESRDREQLQPLLIEVIQGALYCGSVSRLIQATLNWNWSSLNDCIEVQRMVLDSRVPDLLCMPIFALNGLALAAREELLAACAMNHQSCSPETEAQDTHPVRVSEGDEELTHRSGTQIASGSDHEVDDRFEDDLICSATQETPVSYNSLDTLLMLVTLPPQEGALANDALSKLVQSCGARLWAVLRPFYTDLLHHTGTPASPSFSLVRSLQFAGDSPTLQITTMRYGLPESDRLTEHELWQSPTAGLPLRRDWPFAPLDDLLHSGHARALNRADALPEDWDFSEQEIVEATLHVASRAVHLSLGESLRCLPQAAHVWLGIMKVFLLEEEQSQPNSQRYSGKATGRDLYACEPICGQLKTLMHLADCLAYQASSLTLEQAADALRSGVSFYQIYTDLLGLYDAISLGDAIFSRVLLPPLAMSYAADYRRLLWSDYSQCLSTILTSLENAPVATGYDVLPGSQQGATDGLCVIEQESH